MNEIAPGAVSPRGVSLLAVVVIGGLFYLAGQYIASQPSRVAKEAQAQREITVQGSAEIDVPPDVARLTLGVQTGVQPDAATALKLLSTRFDGVVSTIRAAGVKEEDSKATNVSIQPTYDYTEGRQTLRGFAASESIEVTIRELKNVGEVLARATAEGVNQVGGLSFTVDKPEALQQEAQVAAIKDAHEKAQDLARVLGVRLGNVKNFRATSTPSPGEPIPFYARAQEADQLSAPPVPSGTQTITAEVSVTYELK